MSKTPRSHLCSREGTREVRMESELARKHSGFDHVVGKGGHQEGSVAKRGPKPSATCIQMHIMI